MQENDAKFQKLDQKKNIWNLLDHFKRITQENDIKLQKLDHKTNIWNFLEH